MSASARPSDNEPLGHVDTIVSWRRLLFTGNWSTIGPHTHMLWGRIALNPINLAPIRVYYVAYISACLLHGGICRDTLVALLTNRCHRETPSWCQRVSGKGHVMTPIYCKRALVSTSSRLSKWHGLSCGKLEVVSPTQLADDTDVVTQTFACTSLIGSATSRIYFIHSFHLHRVAQQRKWWHNEL